MLLHFGVKFHSPALFFLLPSVIQTHLTRLFLLSMELHCTFSFVTSFISEEESELLLKDRSNYLHAIYNTAISSLRISENKTFPKASGGIYKIWCKRKKMIRRQESSLWDRPTFTCCAKSENFLTLCENKRTSPR